MKMEARTATGGVRERKRTFSWRTLGVLVAAAASTSLLAIPFSITLFEQGDGLQVPAWMLVVGSLIQGIVVAAIFGGLGLWLGPKVGLGAPDLRGVLHGEPGSGRRALSALPLAAGLGVALGIVLLALQAGLMPLLPEAVQRSFEELDIPPPWESLLASISAGVNEEILFRLGLMTLFVFLGARLLRQGGRPPPGWCGRRWRSPRCCSASCTCRRPPRSGAACPPPWWRTRCWETASGGWSSAGCTGSGVSWPP